MNLDQVAIVAIIFVTFYKVIELFAHRGERVMMIEKIESFKGPDFKIPQNLFGQNSGNYSWALKLACLALGAGLGLLVAFAICYFSIGNYAVKEMDWYTKDVVSIVYAACVLLFGGAGLLMAFLIELKMNKKNSDEKKD